MADRVDNHTKTGGEHVESKNKAGSGASLESAPQIQTVFTELKVRRKHRVSDALWSRWECLWKEVGKYLAGSGRLSIAHTSRAFNPNHHLLSTPPNLSQHIFTSLLNHPCVCNCNCTLLPYRHNCTHATIST